MLSTNLINNTCSLNLIRFIVFVLFSEVPLIGIVVTNWMQSVEDLEVVCRDQAQEGGLGEKKKIEGSLGGRYLKDEETRHSAGNPESFRREKGVKKLRL